MQSEGKYSNPFLQFLSISNTNKWKTLSVHPKYHKVSYNACPKPQLYQPCYTGESRRMTEKVKCKLNGAAYIMLARSSGRKIQEDARNPTINVVMETPERRWSWLRAVTHARAPPGALSHVKTMSQLLHKTLSQTYQT